MEEDKPILYDILEPYEWPAHKEIIPGEVPRSLWKSLATTAKGCIHYGVQKIAHSLRSIPPLSVCELLTNTICWKIALSSDGKLLAVLQETHVELRCLDDEFVVAIAKCGVSPDCYPQWRKMVWNEDSAYLAVVNSSGEVFVISSEGQRLCHIDNKTSEEKDLSQAAAGISFMPASSQHASSSVGQLIVTSISGLLSCYIIQSSGQYSLSHTFSFTSHYPYGVGSVLYQPQYHIIIVAAISKDTDGVKLSKWRTLDSAPHYAMIEGEELVKKSNSILTSFGQLLPYQQPSNDDSWVFSMKLSPSGSILATVDVSGNISFYDVPSLRLRRQWSIKEQFDALCMKEDVLSGSSTKPNKNELPRPLNISWWSEKALAIVNNQGKLTVSNIKSFDNMLGAAAEKCEPLVCLTSAHNNSHKNSLLFLECEQNTTSMTTPLESVTESSESEDVSPTKRAIKHLLYSVTELERFQPPRKKPRVISQTYRIVCLKEIDSKELFKRKIDNEEFGDALQLAKIYNELDCDLVYQQQWKTFPISKATIEDYLSRVSKQRWVISQCLNCVTDDYNAMTDLLKYGLIRTSISEVISDLSIEITDIHLVEEVLKGIERFTNDQLFLVTHRIKLLNYIDRLSLLQEILGGPVATDEQFSGMEFRSFRDRSLVTLAVDYAQQGNWKAVDLLLSYHGNQTLPHRLAILSNFPETISPDDYASLLPAVSASGVLVPWQQKSWRSSCDWCELEACKRLLPSEGEQESGEFLYQESPQMIDYKSATNHDVISMWYHDRAREIERLSGEVLNSLTLIEIAKDYGIKNTAEIHDDLLTLKSIVFDRAVDTRMCLANLEKMPASEKLALLMKDVEANEFADYFQQYTTPFLLRQEGHHPGTSEQLLTDYLCVVAKNDLRPCLCIFTTAHTEHPAHPLLKDTVKLIQLILNCMYSSERRDQLSVADQIFECIPEEKDNDPADLVQLHRKVDALDNHLHAVDVLQQYEIEKPIVYIRTIQDNVDEARKLMIRIARSASRRKPPLKESDWLILSEQLLGLQRNVFKCLEENICYKIIAESLLSSGLHSNIILGGQLLAHNSHQHPVQSNTVPSEDSAKRKTVSPFVCKISFNESVELVLSAAREYFNSAGDSADHDMALARYCLDIIKEPVDEIISEHQLIEAIGILGTCQVNIIPVQVRLCEHKLDIVKKALQSNPALSKNAAKVLKFSKLLGLKSAEGGIETLTGELGQAMILVAQTAMMYSEFDTALEICHKLVSTPTPDAWEVCSELATVDRVQDLQIRISLLQFALTHCPAGEIKKILQVLRTTETEDLYQQCMSTSSNDTQSTAGRVLQRVGYNTVHQLVAKGTGIVQQLIKPDIQSLGEGGKMSSYIHWMSSAATALNDYWRSTVPHPSSPSSLSDGHLNTSQLVQSFHPFYNNSLTASSNDYTVLRPIVQPSGTLQLNQAILRTTLLLADYSERGSDINEILLNMAQSCAKVNLPLFLAYLLALPDPMKAKLLLQGLEPSMLTLHVAIYYVCLQITILVDKCDSSLYLLPPATIVAHVSSHVTFTDHSDWPEKAKELLEYLKELSTQLCDLMQGKTLQEFDLAIDIEKFTQNAGYKRQVILMLVRNINSTYLSTGMKLAARYEVSKWEVLMEHLDWLLTESKLTNQVMQNHISQIGVGDVALQKPQETVDHLMTIVHPRIAGTDHNLLLVCLSLVEKCVSMGVKDTQLVDVSTQIKLLKRFKSSLQAVDFKALMSGHNPLMVLQPHLSSENVHVVAKVAAKIPLSSGGHLQASDIFKTFAEKLFWELPPNKEKNNAEGIDWLYRRQCCHEYLERLSTAEYEDVIKNVTISPMALELIPVDVRRQIVQECIKFSKSKSCKMNGLEVKMEQLMKHLKIVNNKALSQLASKEEWTSLYEEFAMSNSDTDKVHTLVIKMITAGLDQQLINNILTLSRSVVPHSLQMSSLMREALETSLDNLSDDKYPSKKILLAISNMLKSCQNSQDASLMDIVLSILSDYYKSCNHSADARISILELIEQTNALPLDDIVQYKTEAILCDQFDIKIDQTRMTSCDDRQSLVEQLVAQAVSMDQLLTIVKLLRSWPDPITTHVASWGDLLVQLSLQPGGHVQTLLIRAGLEGIPLEADVKLYENLSSNFSAAFKVAIISKQESLLQRAMEDAGIHFRELSDDYDILELVICCGQAHCIVNSPLYPSLHHYLLNDTSSSDNLTLPIFAAILHCREEEVEQALKLHHPMDRVRIVSEQLYNHGYWLEAGALLLRSHRTHPALVTTGNAVSLLHKLFKK